MSRWWRFVARLTNSGTSPRVAPVVQALGRVHARLYRASGGRLGRKFFGADVVVLEVPGRKSGELRATPLCFVPDGEDWILLASNGGSPKTPAWWLNLRAAGRGVAVMGKRRVEVTAREARPDERDRMFELFATGYPPARDYLGFTDRAFPVVVISPVR